MVAFPMPALATLALPMPVLATLALPMPVPAMLAVGPPPTAGWTAVRAMLVRLRTEAPQPMSAMA
jgi:hypothetical protein